MPVVHMAPMKIPDPMHASILFHAGEYTEPGKVIKTASGVTVVGFADLPSRLPTQVSNFFLPFTFFHVCHSLCAHGLQISHKGGKVEVISDYMNVLRCIRLKWPQVSHSVAKEPSQSLARLGGPHWLIHPHPL